MKALQTRRLLWLLPLVAAVINIVATVRASTPWGADWRDSGGTLLDFRDLVVVPGRWLWHGGNPYDPVPYLAAHPWAQEFDPYAPAWLLISAALGWLPVKLAAAIYLILGTLFTAWVVTILSRWATGSRAWWVAPLVVTWCQVWFPTRNASSSFLVVCGVALALRFARSPGRQQWLAILGVALSLLKPQFGVPFCLLLAAAGHWRVMLRGVAAVTLASLPPLTACIVAAGGVVGFAESILRVVHHASSPEAPTGLLTADNRRVDLPAMVARLTGAEPPGWVSLIALGLVIVTVVVLVLRRPSLDVAALTILPMLYLPPVHLSYDIVVMLVALAAAASLWRRTGEHAALGTAFIAALPVAHLHRVSGVLGIPALMADVLDWAMVVLVWITGLVLALRLPASSRFEELQDVPPEPGVA